MRTTHVHNPLATGIFLLLSCLILSQFASANVTRSHVKGSFHTILSNHNGDEIPAQLMQYYPSDKTLKIHRTDTQSTLIFSTDLLSPESVDTVMQWATNKAISESVLIKASTENKGSRSSTKSSPTSNNYSSYSSSQVRTKSTSSTSKKAYQVELRRMTQFPIENLTLKYRIYKKSGDKDNWSHVSGSYQTKQLSSESKETFVTIPIDIIKKKTSTSQTSTTTYYSNGTSPSYFTQNSSKTSSNRDSLKGIVIEFYNGTTLVKTWASSQSLMDK